MFRRKRRGIGSRWISLRRSRASWELRCGPDNRFRIFYDVDLASQKVHVLAVGVKDRSRLLMGGEEYEL
jgi:hypothetical protein